MQKKNGPTERHLLYLSIGWAISIVDFLTAKSIRGIIRMMTEIDKEQLGREKEAMNVEKDASKQYKVSPLAWDDEQNATE